MKILELKNGWFYYIDELKVSEIKQAMENDIKYIEEQGDVIIISQISHIYNIPDNLEHIEQYKSTIKRYHDYYKDNNNK